MNKTLSEIIMHHVGASGPVSFQSIMNYVDEQYDGIWDGGPLAEAITLLIHEGKMAMDYAGYSDLVTFVAVAYIPPA